VQNADLPESFTIFPRDFDKHFFDYIDKRYLAILFTSIAVHLGIVFFLVTNPPSQKISQVEINRMQKRFANLILDQETIAEQTQFAQIEEPIAPAEEESSASEPAPGAGQKDAAAKGRQATASSKPASGEASRETRVAAAGQRRRTRDQIKSEVKTQGLLGLLSSTSTKAAGDEVQDVLGTELPNSNLDKKLAGGAGLTKASGDETGTGKGGVRGERETTGGGIDNVVGGLEKSKTSNKVSRTGELEVQEETSLLEGEEGEVLQGTRDQEAVSAVVQSHNAAVQFCYQRILKRNPNLKGKIVVRFTITPQGSVSQVTVLSSTLNNSSVENCIASRIKRWNDFGAIDPSKGDTTIRQVYTFGY
jgi:TonB family protein